MSTREDDLDTDTGGGLAPFARRAPRISQADVFRAADELLVDGNRPTIDRVRMRLGRGSPNTINDHLDAWWTKLGSRLRDLPGREFPQLPETVAHALQHLWNTALDGAQEALQTALQEREEAVRQAEIATRASLEEADVRARAAITRAEVLGEELVAAAHRCESLEGALREREHLLTQARTHAQALEATSDELRAQLIEADRAHRDERTRREEQHSAAESRWLQEVDRARAASKDVDRRADQLQTQLKKLQADNEALRVNLAATRAELTATVTVHAQLQERIKLLSRTAAPAKRTRSGPPPAKRGSGGKRKLRRPRSA